VDHHRSLRCGFPEVIFCRGKTVAQTARIAREILAKGSELLATRATPEVHRAIRKIDRRARWHEAARCVTVGGRAPAGRGYALVVSAGTADIPVAEEARVTAEALGARVRTLYDVGVAGLHRLLAHRSLIMDARVLVVVAGMEGALASVVGGLVRRPVIAVPTSVGYGANFEGLATLLAMLNSCASGVTVVNIDNGFGAGYSAALMTRD
jgi:NCAIR mutase (PurE)-related protein